MTARAAARCRFLGPALIAIALVLMLAFTWDRWPDPIVDFGRELYVPWQLAAGKVLYRDLAHLNGPLSQYFNAMIFRIFGASLRILVLTNIAIALAVIVMIWKLFRLAGDRLCATVACLLFITLFMAMQYVSIGNYNWITPYSHELTHGVALSLAAILALLRFRIRGRKRDALLCGILLGLVFLTKPEVFAAIAPVIVGGMLLPPRRASCLGVFVAGAICPALISVIALSCAMSVREALHGTLGAWPYLTDRRLSAMRFYRLGMGTDAPLTNAIRALGQASAYVAILAPAAALDLASRGRSNRVRVILAATYAAIVLAVALVLGHRWIIAWYECFRGLTPVMIVASLFAIFAMDKRHPRAMLRAALICFATLLLAKIVLASRVYHYGFALALPATTVLAAMAISWIPSHRKMLTVKLTAIALLTVVACNDLNGYAHSFRIRDVVIAGGTSDEFLADQRGQIDNVVLRGLDQIPPSATLAVLPQGVMLNYLSGHVNPTPFVTLMPPEVTAFGDDAIARAYARTPPDFVVIIPEQFGEYGFKSFEAFAPKTAAWIRANYSPAATLHHPTLHIVLLQRNR